METKPSSGVGNKPFRFQVQLICRDTADSTPPTQVTQPEDVVRLMREEISRRDREVFYVIYLDVRNRVIGYELISQGTLSATLVHPREVFKGAILANASGIILCHNHPSGDPTPSEEDRSLTRTLKDAGKLLGLDVLDHIILSETSKFYSFEQETK